MIFYLAVDENDRRRLCATKEEARAVNKQFEKVDIPTDKAGIMAFVQELYTQIDAERSILEGAAEIDGLTLRGEPAPPDPVVRTETVEKAVPIPSEELSDTQLFNRLAGDMAEVNRRAGYAGWANFAKNTYRWAGACAGTERTLGMLLLAGLSNLSTAEVVPAHKRQIGVEPPTEPVAPLVPGSGETQQTF